MNKLFLFFQFRDHYEKGQYDLKQAIEDRESMAKNFKQILDRS